MDKKHLWTLAQEIIQAFGPFYQDAMRQAIQDSGVPDQWFALNLAHGYDPAPFTVERFHALTPYTAQKRQSEILETLAQLELLERVGQDAYRLTDRGRATVEKIFKAAHQKLGTVEPLPAGKVQQLNTLLYRIVEATLNAPEPETKHAIIGSRWTDPGESAAPSVKTDQYLTDLYRYRDDAHLAAWKPYNVSGQAWEALTFIWRGDASTPEELAEKLTFRSHTAQVYEEALQNLVERGWVTKEADSYKLTDKGKQLREEAEEATERYFYIGWSVLNDDELAQLETLLAQAKEYLQAAAPQQEPDAS